MKNNKKLVIKDKFVIPQIDSKYDGLKKSKPAFQRSVAVSPFYGRNVKDTLFVPDTKGSINVDKAYDSFRPKGEKHLSKEELIAQYGTEYYEFGIVNKKDPNSTLAALDEMEEPIPAEITKEENDVHQNNGEEPVGIPEDEIQEASEELKIGLVKPHLDFGFDLEAEQEESAPVVNVESRVEPQVQEMSTSTIDEIADDSDKYENYQFPPLSFFKYSSTIDDDIPEWLIRRKDILNKTLSDFDIDGEVVNYTKGPAFTRYEILLAPGVKVAKVNNITDDIHKDLEVKSIRILAPIPGKKTIGVEVPNDKTETVYFGDIVDEDFVHDGNPLRISLGKNIDGQTVTKAINDMPHCLIAGATKSGKSVCMNTLLISLLIKNKPSDLKLILIDPKKVELIAYEDIPHLATPVISDPQMASISLQWAVAEMERRYNLLSVARVRNLEDYNRKAQTNKAFKKLPYIVIVIDELADLMMTCSSDVEDSIKRITQKARAAGIHLIVATQRPTVQVVSGNIKANIPTRIAFRVASAIDSTTILDEGGAENLLGRGDMLIKESEAPERVQGAFISDAEIDKVCDFLRSQAEPDYIITHDDLKEQYEKDDSEFAGNQGYEPESILYEVAKFCINAGSGSINMIQPEFGLGFRRAKRIVTILGERGILSKTSVGSKGREVLVDLAQLNEMFEKDE